MPIKCHFCENNTHPPPHEKCERIFITPNEALSILDYSDYGVHVFLQSPHTLIGADWSVPSIVDLLESANHIEISGGASRGMKHAVCVHVSDNEWENHFLATNEEKLSEFIRINNVL